MGEEPQLITVKPEGFAQGVFVGLVDTLSPVPILNVELPGPENFGGEGFLLAQTVLSVIDAKNAIKSLPKLAKEAPDLFAALIEALSSKSNQKLLPPAHLPNPNQKLLPLGKKEPPLIQPVLKGPIPDQPPRSLTEQLLLQDAKGGTGTQIMKNPVDKPRLDNVYGPGDWVKMEHKRKNPDGTNTVIHWFRDLKSGNDVEFKFKNPAPK